MLNSYAKLFVDCQSTGASPATSSLLELACNEQSWVVKQDQEVPRKILRLIGLTSEEIQLGHTPGDVFADLSKMVNQARDDFGDHVFAVAHFSRFEQVYLDRLWQSHGEGKFPVPLVCTHKLSKLLYPRLPNYGLRALAGWFGMPLDEGKRAINHVVATKQIWQALAVELEKKGVSSLVELQDYLAQKPERTSGRRDFLISREKRLNLPSAPGVYRYIDRSGRILYVGKATSLKSRVNSYFTGGCRGDHRKLEMLAQAVDIEVTTTVAPIYAGLLEYDEIRRLKPPYNIAFKGQGRDPLKPLDLLSGVLADFNPSRHAGVIKDTFYDLEDMETLRQGIALWRLQSMIRPEQPLVPRQLLNLGLPLLKKWITEEKERRLALQQDLEQELVEDVEEDDSAGTEEEICWTAEMVADNCRRIIRRATRHYIRSKWLLRLSESTIQLSLTESSRGKLKKNANVLTINPSGQTGAFDFRRVRILVHELRRAESKGAAWQVIKPWPMAVPFWI